MHNYYNRGNVFKNLIFLTKICEESDITYYFLNKERKILVPIGISGKSLELKQYSHSIYDTLNRTLKATKTEIINLKIYLYQDDILYSYLTVKNMRNIYEINIEIADAIYLFEILNTNVLIEENVLREYGVKVTKEMLEKALA